MMFIVVHSLLRHMLRILCLSAATIAFPSPLSQVRAPDITSCLDSYQVGYIAQDSPKWKHYSTPYNLRLIYTPNIITLPKTAQEVSYAVKCSAAAGLKVQPKSGGHSYASFSSGGRDGSVIVDMENFNSVVVDHGSWIANVGAGVRIGNMALALYKQGKRALPHGTCPGVGIGGHATHGGYGYTSRKWGLTLDKIVALDVILSNGTAAHATKTNFPDLFFAMRGAGDSFGIVTNFYFETLPAPASILAFSANLEAALSAVQIAAAGFHKMQEYLLTSDDLTTNITLGLYIDSDGAFRFNGWCMDCDLNHFKAVILPAMVSGFPVTALIVKEKSYLDGLLALAGSDSLIQPLEGYNKHDTFYAKSVVTKNAKPLTLESILSFWTSIIDNQGKGPFYTIINLYGGPHSAINTPSADFAAYSDRDALWVFQNYGYTSNGLLPFDPSAMALIEDLNDAITSSQPSGDFGAYLNYVDPSLTARQAAALYYGPETYGRLLKIKKQVDPDFVFWNPQAIGNV